MSKATQPRRVLATKVPAMERLSPPQRQVEVPVSQDACTYCESTLARVLEQAGGEAERAVADTDAVGVPPQS